MPDIDCSAMVVSPDIGDRVGAKVGAGRPGTGRGQGRGGGERRVNDALKPFGAVITEFP